MSQAPAPPSPQYVVTTVDAGVLTIRLSDPDRLNAMGEEMKDGIAEALARAKHDKAVRAVLLTGTGRAFSAGGDINTMAEGLRTAPLALARLRDAHARLTLPLLELEKPTIAAINGVAAGAGVAMALGCDLRVMRSGASMVFAFAKLGLVPDFGTGYLLPRLVGLARAHELSFRGRITAEEAREWGLVTEVTSPEDCLPRALEIATSLAAGPTLSLGLTKHLLDRSFHYSLKDFLDLEANYQAIASQSEDHINAREGFIAKTPVEFTGR